MNVSLAKRTAAIGKELMQEAEQNLLNKMRNEVKQEFEYVLLRMELHTKEREKAEQWLEFFTNKKKALETGKFDITSSGQLIMNDPELQQEMCNQNNMPNNIRRK
jgi:hypothetical protein